MTIKGRFGEFINQLQMSISGWKVSPAADFHQWVNQDESQDFWWCRFPPPHREYHRPGFGTNLSSVPQGLCFVFREFGTFIFLENCWAFATSCKKKPSNVKGICKYDGAFHRRSWAKYNPRNYYKQVRLVLGRLKSFFTWTTNQGLGYVKRD